MNISTPKFAAQAIRKATDIGWAPLQLIVNASSSISTVLMPAGLSNAEGLITAAFIKEPGDPAWAQDEDVKAYVAFLKKWDSQDPPDDVVGIMGYVAANTLNHVLQRAGPHLTRDNVMTVAKSLDAYRPPMLLPGIALTTTPKDVAPYRQLRLQRFSGQKWVLLD